MDGYGVSGVGCGLPRINVQSAIVIHERLIRFNNEPWRCFNALQLMVNERVAGH